MRKTERGTFGTQNGKETERRLDVRESRSDERTGNPTGDKKGLDFFTEDILIEILSRLPLRTLARVRCTSKTLNQLISQNSFLLKQAQNSTRNVLGLIREPVGYGGSAIYYLPLETNVTQEFLQIPWKRRMKIAASCNGSLLCSCPNDSHHLYLYNPTTNMKFVLQSPRTAHYYSVYGLAVDLLESPRTDFNVVRSWKVVVIKYCQTIRFNVCSLEMPEWRVSRGTMAFDRSALVGSIGPVYFNGAIHWVTRKSNLIAFHVETESARAMKLPVKIRSYDKCTNVWLGSTDGRMNLVEVLQEAISVWVLQDYENVTWKKKCCIDMGWMSLFQMLRDNENVVCKEKCSFCMGWMCLFPISCCAERQSDLNRVPIPTPIPVFCNGNWIVLTVDMEFFSYNFKTSSWKHIGRMKCWMDWSRRYFPFISNTVGRDLQGFY